MKSIITIADIRPPGEGKQSARITTTGGESLWLWSSKLGLVKVGSTYEADVEEKNGFKNIKTVKQVEAPAAPSQFTPRQTAPAGVTSKDQQIFVQGVLQALIRAGEVKNDKRDLWNATQMLCDLWEHSRLSGHVPYSQAAE